MLQKIRVMIYLIFVQYMKHRMQITQELWEYDLTTNSVKFIYSFIRNKCRIRKKKRENKQTCDKRLHHCQKGTVVFVTNTYCGHRSDKLSKS